MRRDRPTRGNAAALRRGGDERGNGVLPVDDRPDVRGPKHRRLAVIHRCDHARFDEAGELLEVAGNPDRNE